MNFPQAISLASGRPDAGFFDLQNSLGKLEVFVRQQMAASQQSRDFILEELGQYNKAQGIIAGHLSRLFAKDEGIVADPADIIVTVGAQEAMLLVLHTLCHPDYHTIAVENPTYPGFSLYPKIAGFDLAPVHFRNGNLDLEELEEKIAVANANNKPIRLLYVIPDFQNPSGSCMSLETREVLLENAKKHDFYILEDNAYGYFRYEGEKIPAIKSLDRENRTIYIGSFSKVLFPGIRLAGLVAGQKFQLGNQEVSLSHEMTKLKGYVTLNSPSITQAILGGYLIENDFSFQNLIFPKVEACRIKRDALVAALQEYLGKFKSQITWNVPQGGFFLSLQLPFRVSDADVMECAKRFGVIFCPMSMFYLNGKGGENEIRLAFSHVELSKIKEAVFRLCQFVQSKINL
ncbi:MAG: PLP-dependent aminotransferase family protein [Saprospiraceae bacterium]